MYQCRFLYQCEIFKIDFFSDKINFALARV